MNQQPYQTPPRLWTPRLSPRWMSFWRRYRKRIAVRQHALRDVAVVDRHHLDAARQTGGGVLITPNHPSHADPFVLLEAADQLRTPMYFMAAWQVFHDTHRIGRQVLRQHGCFSINREGHDVAAVRQAIRILEAAEAPLVIFPEGEVFHLNDQVTPFRKGAIHTAVLAAERSGKPVSVVPCGIKFQFTADPSEELHRRMDHLEQSAGFRSFTSAPLADRIFEFGTSLLERRETKIFGGVRLGPLQPRIMHVIAAVLVPLEHRFQVSADGRSIPERVKRLRHRIIRRLEASASDDCDKFEAAQLRRALRRLFTVMQAYSYPVEYLLNNPSVERLAETIEKLEEDVLNVRKSAAAGNRRAIVAFDQPIVIRPETARVHSIASQTDQLQRRVQSLIDGLIRVELPVEAGPLDDSTNPMLAA